MQITYVEQYNGEERIEYKVEGETITATALGQRETIDLSILPDGAVVEAFEPEHLGFSPILSAKREGGELVVELLKWTGDRPPLGLGRVEEVSA